MDQVIQLISSVGFPIACCIYMMINGSKQKEELAKALTELRLAQNDLKNAIQVLTDYFKGGEHK